MGHIKVPPNAEWRGFTTFRPKPEGWKEYNCPLMKAVCNCGMPNGEECEHWQPGNPFTFPNQRPSYCVAAKEAFDKGEPWL